MSSLRPTLRRAARVSLCVLALGTGGVLAYATRGMPHDEVGRFPLPMPLASTMPALTAVTIAPDPLVEQPPEPEPPVELEPRIGTLAPSLAGGQIISGATPHRLILFTFDDGPDIRYTPRLLDSLDEYGIRAVFFLTAYRMAGTAPWQRRNRELAREIARRGHIIANHTVDHVQLPLLDTMGVRAQVEGADAVFEELFGGRSWLIRPPGGSRSARVDNLRGARGYTQVLWNLGTGDFQVSDPEAVLRTFRRVLARRERENGERGGIVLLHDTHEWSVDALPRIVGWLRQRNCELAERGEELYDIVDDPRYFHTARGDEGASTLAPPAEPALEVLARRQHRIREETQQRCARVAAR